MGWVKYGEGKYKVNDNGTWVAIYKNTSSSSKQKNTYWAERAAKKWIDDRN